MSTYSGPSPTAPTFAVRNMVGKGKEISQENLDGPASDAALREDCDKHYNQLFLILAEKIHTENIQQEKLSRRITKKERLKKKDDVQKNGEMCVPHARRQGEGAFAQEEQNLLQKETIAKEGPHLGRKHCPKGKTVQEGIGSQDQKSRSQVLRMMIFPNHWYGRKHILSHLGSVWFDDHPQESIESYVDLKKAFLENYLHQKKCIKDLVKIHNIKQRDGESMKEFERRSSSSILDFYLFDLDFQCPPALSSPSDSVSVLSEDPLLLSFLFGANYVPLE
nr:reverse transcriptase domain-containing protein [Tanacetum cinerariifolium]